MAETDELWDVIIIGAGAAGMTAAIYTTRKTLKTLVVSTDVGGQTNLTNHIENYPGVEPTAGSELMYKFMKQAEGFGAKFKSGKISKVEEDGEDFKVTLTNGDVYRGRSIILCFGKSPRELGIPGEKEFMGKGVSICVTCDAPLFKGKITAVIGGGNSAVEGALELNNICEKVYLVHRRQEFRADEITQKKLKEAKNLELVLDSVPTEIKGDTIIKSLSVENVKTKEKREIKLDGVFIEIGYEVKTDFVSHLVERNKMNEIVINKSNGTSHPGIFAAGDNTIVPYKQTIISAGEGAKAGLQAYNYLQKKEGKPSVMIDW